MISITTKSPYAIKALAELGRVGGDAPVPIGELGYLLSPEARGRGVMTSALRLVIDWALGDPLRLERVQAMTDPANEASMRVLERLGFVREGVLRSYRPSPAPGVTGREDRVIWSLLPVDWRAP